ncbi:hypothetical protein Tco_0425554 [Tanacetum coccineum]
MLLNTRKRVHSFLACVPRLSCRRFRYVSSSSSPRKRHRASPYSSSSSSFETSHSSSNTSAASDTPILVRPSHKRCRSPSTSLSAATLLLTTLEPEVSIKYSTEGGNEVTIEDAIEPDISPLLPEQTELEDEQRAMKDKAETAETERINLRERCQPRNIGGTEGVVGLARWFEKMKFLFRISNCATGSQVKFATCTLDDGALTWTTPVYTYSAATDPNVGGVIGGTPYRSVFCGIDRSVMGMSWKDLMKLMIEVYWPRNEVQKLESEL